MLPKAQENHKTRISALDKARHTEKTVSKVKTLMIVKEKYTLPKHNAYNTRRRWYNYK